MVAHLPLAVLLLAGTTYAGRIVGGEETSIENYPSIVSFESWGLWPGEWGHTCGGSILTTFWILSAAHCFIGDLYQPSYRRIRAGSSYRNTGGVVHYVDYEINHPEYNVAVREDADIGVVRLLTPLVYTPVIQKGTIVMQNDIVPDNHPVVHAGWGTLYFQGPAAPVLRHVQTYVVNHELCAHRYRTLYNSEVITEKMLCTGVLDVGGRDVCSGDSGGPTYSGNVIVGVTSFGMCGNPTYPGVLASVAYFSDWIIANAR